ncbi:MAG: glutamine synthetase family protein [SAR324 cluster bacterium]|nr:glutamine synthetase family protein [SAR324 cluster bacterium]MED5435204.1 glutamine synthetase family protein [SAR324 cluster bacterium]
MKVYGMLTLEELQQQVDSREIDTVLVVFTDLYGRFMGKRFDAEFFLEDAVKNGTHCCDYLVTVDMEMDPVSGYEYTNWERGYGDFHIVPDFSTLRKVSWLDRSAMVLCDVKENKTHELTEVAPRSMLRKQVDLANELGFTAKAGSELEYFIFQNSFQEAAEKGYNDLKPAGWYIEDYHSLQGTRVEHFNGDVRRHLRDSGIPVENSKGEAALGQHELNVRYAEVLTMADRHALYKQCLKEVAEQKDISVTFMSKYKDGQPGSSCHIHLSLWKGDENAFPGGLKEGPIECSETFRWFLGGWIKHMPEMMVFYAPTINSYKRYETKSWAPTRMAWCHDNRTAGFRVVGKGPSLRIECRIPGADCNPYLAYTAAMASGLDGIRNKTEPPPMFEGDVYSADELPEVPMTLREALTLFEQSNFAKTTFGDAVHKHYIHFFLTEAEAYEAAVTDWELKRYFERI